MIDLSNLREIRTDSDVSQSKVAETLGVTRETVTKWETGVSIPSFKEIYGFAKLFNYSIDYVLGLTRNRNTVIYEKYNKQLVIKNLKKLRLDASLSVRALAAKLGVSHVAVVRYENGQSNPSLDILHKYHKIFNVR